MLAALLPGLRDLRAPLSAGYLWLASACILIFGYQSKLHPPRTQPWSNIFQIATSANHVLLLGIASFAAYVIGVLTRPLARLLTELPRQWYVVTCEARYADEASQEVNLDSGNAFNAEFEDRFDDSNDKADREADDKFDEPYRVRIEVPLSDKDLSHKDSWPAHVDAAISIVPFPTLRRKNLEALDFTKSGHGVAFKLNNASLPSLPKCHQLIHALRYKIIQTPPDQIHWPRVMRRVQWRPFGYNLRDVKRSESDKTRAQWVAFYAGLSVESILGEIEDAPIRLLGKDPELYASYDRSRAEAEFRSLLVPPSVVLAGVLAISSYWWLGLLFVPVILRQQSRQLSRYANDILAEAMRVGRIESATVTAKLTPDELIARQFGIRSHPKVIQSWARSELVETQQSLNQ